MKKNPRRMNSSNEIEEWLKITGKCRLNGVFDEKTKNSEEERLREEIIKFKEGKK